MRIMLSTLIRPLAWLAPLLQLAACTHGSTPQFDARFGAATRLAMAQQVRDPAAVNHARPADGLDGASARAVMERYRASFAEPNGQVAAPVQLLLGGNGGK